MNSTDKQKLAIRKMFEQPIEEVEEAYWSLRRELGKPDWGKGTTLIELEHAITNLKDVLPIIQS